MVPGYGALEAAGVLKTAGKSAVWCLCSVRILKVLCIVVTAQQAISPYGCLK